MFIDDNRIENIFSISNEYKQSPCGGELLKRYMVNFLHHYLYLNTLLCTYNGL